MKNLTKEEQQLEIEKCKSFEYFYNNYCKRDGMPEYSEEAYQDYLRNVEESRYIIGKTRSGKKLHIKLYLFTPDKAFKL